MEWKALEKFRLTLLKMKNCNRETDFPQNTDINIASTIAQTTSLRREKASHSSGRFIHVFKLPIWLILFSYLIV